jgi:hypothetical protein
MAADAQAEDSFGAAVSISGDYAIVGAHSEDEGGAEAGAAYVFHRTGTNTWDAGVKLLASEDSRAIGSDRFGWSVSISGDYAIVGSIDSEQAQVFHRTGTNSWEAGPTMVGHSRFAYSVAISDEYAVAGAFGESGGGAVYVYH